MMADLRMLQQQSQEIQILLASVTEALKAVKRLRRGDPARDSFGRTAEEVLREIDHTQGDG